MIRLPPLFLQIPNKWLHLFAELKRFRLYEEIIFTDVDARCAIK